MYISFSSNFKEMAAAAAGQLLSNPESVKVLGNVAMSDAGKQAVQTYGQVAQTGLQTAGLFGSNVAGVAGKAAGTFTWAVVAIIISVIVLVVVIIIIAVVAEKSSFSTAMDQMCCGKENLSNMYDIYSSGHKGKKENLCGRGDCRGGWDSMYGGNGELAGVYGSSYFTPGKYVPPPIRSDINLVGPPKDRFVAIKNNM